MKANELRKMSIDALKEMVSVKRSEIVAMRLDFSKGGEKGHVRKLRSAKKDLAKALTIITEKSNER